MDLSGLPEAAVDSEEEEEEDEDLERASDTLLGRDLVRECLEKEPADRNDDDIGEFRSPPPSEKHRRHVSPRLAAISRAEHSEEIETLSVFQQTQERSPETAAVSEQRCPPVCIFKQAIREAASLAGPSGVLEEKVTTSESRERVVKTRPAARLLGAWPSGGLHRSLLIQRNERETLWSEREGACGTVVSNL